MIYKSKKNIKQILNYDVLWYHICIDNTLNKIIKKGKIIYFANI